ncbi:hypothetical protein EI555_011679, partial [Monodon monoceros]
RITSTLSSTNTYSKCHRLTNFSNTSISNTNNSQLLIQHFHMTSISKITYHVFFRQSHSTCYCSHSYPNTLKLYRGHCSNNCPLPHIIHIILPSKFKLQTNLQQNNCSPSYTIYTNDTNYNNTNIYKITHIHPLLFLNICASSIICHMIYYGIFNDLCWLQLENPPNLASSHSLSNRRPSSRFSSIHSSTRVIAAICALTQNDIKKIVAFSTSSQLGLIIVTICINQPYLAFLHVCTHAFFKAILFICSGSIIHSLHDEQDIRKIGGLFKAIPFTTAALIIASLSLTGMLFLTGFYSKELIIDTANTFCLWHSHYFLRTIRTTSLFYFNENNPLLINSVKRLLAVSIFAGFITSSKIPPMTIPQITIPDYLKRTAFAVTILGFILAFEISPATQNLKFKYPSNFFKFSNLLGISPLLYTASHHT